MQFLVSSLDARRADEGRSFFSKAGGATKLGEKLFPEAITLVSDPGSPETPGAPFDEQGVPLRRVAWIDKGAVAAFSYSRFWADKKGKAATGMAVIDEAAAIDDEPLRDWLMQAAAFVQTLPIKE